MQTPREKFQELLKKLFQFDCAELDFGIYRIMNQKRAVIEQFIDKDLLDAVTTELSSGALAQEAGLAQQLTEVAAKVRESFGDDSLDAEGNLIKGQDLPLGKEYLALRDRAGRPKSSPELEAQIFNHLYAFFSRYYDEGDFMSLRRYSKRNKYAIPYNGEEVYLHWANSDQYYIKTAENFTDYSYRHGGWTVRFKLRNADVEQNNVKGAKRFFLPRLADVGLEPATRTLTIPFEYRLLTPQEEIIFKSKPQETILAEAAQKIVATAKPNTDALAALLHEKRKDTDGNPVSLLDHHLRVYARKNTSDFFIHKDLGDFLERELDVYLKNEVLNLDELEAGGEARAESWFQILRAIKAIGRKIIAFVAQIENFQKRLFEKKKFVTEVHYCVTLDRVPEELYPEIAKNKAQITEWKRLFHIHEIKGDLAMQGFKEPVKAEFLKANPFLVLDTKFFSAEFTEKLLASKEILKGASALDEAIDGLLVHGENLQVLHFLKERFRESISCIYIDPPYNTGSDGFPYKDSYQHSSWLAMMRDRLSQALEFLPPDGVLYVSIGEEEVTQLEGLLDKLVGRTNRLGTVVWKARVKPVNIGEAKYRPQNETEYVLAYEREDDKAQFQPLLTGAVRTYPHELKGRRYRLTTILKSNRGANYRTTMSFELEGYTPPEGQRWQAGEDQIRWLWDNGYIEFKDGTPFRRYFEDEEGAEHDPFYCFMEQEWSGTSEVGKSELNHLLGNMHGFDTVKPKRLMMTLLMASSPPASWVLDFFGGSGTTGHAVIQLCRDTETKRHFILAESGEYFDQLLKPRILKAIYSKDWKDSKPVSREGGTCALKYLNLESYEDALDNITFQSSNGQAVLQLEDYVLSYMLNFETKESDTLLNVAKLDSPFDYKLRRYGKDEPLPVDLPETFNYLIGLHVASRRVYDNKGTPYLVYRGRAEGRETAVIWRTTRGWDQKDFEADRDFMAKQKLTEGAEDVLVNTDSFIPGARSLDPVFKRRMFNEDDGCP